MSFSTRMFEFVEGDSRKFWNITRTPLGYQVHYGRIGTKGQQQEKTFADETKAQKEYDKIVGEKLKKGYTETTPRPAAQPATLTEALEAAIDDHPEDNAAWMALADHLAEQNAPLGEWMQIQIALEDEKRPAAERTAVKTREKELLKKHRKQWLGPLMAKPKEHWEARWYRGHLHTVFVENLEWEEARFLAGSPIARFLHTLKIASMDSYNPEWGDEVPEGQNPDKPTTALNLAATAPWLMHLRHLSIGEMVDFEDDTYSSNGTTGSGLIDVLRLLPRLESFAFYGKLLDLDRLFALRMPRLRTLTLYHLREVHRLGILADNSHWPALEIIRIHPSHQWGGSAVPRREVIRFLESPYFPNLREIHLHASDLGDEGCRAIVQSGLLTRLRVLNLRHGCIRDEGARTLLTSPDLRRLERLDLRGNEIGTDVAKEIDTLGPTFMASDQSEPGGDAYLYSGDIE